MFESFGLRSKIEFADQCLYFHVFSVLSGRQCDFLVKFHEFQEGFLCGVNIPS